jgi:hypothetical protein
VFCSQECFFEYLAQFTEILDFEFLQGTDTKHKRRRVRRFLKDVVHHLFEHDQEGRWSEEILRSML